MKDKEKMTCPQCGKPADWKGNPYHPFCSERCRLIDLGQWAAEKYRIPGEKMRQDDLPENKDRQKENK